MSGWMVNDIHRGAFAYYGFPLLARLMRWHRIVREDGRLSIARGFRRADWRKLIDESGIDAGGAADRSAARLPAVRRTSALIVGGGPAGAAAAIALARGGAMPVLIERCAGERDLGLRRLSRLGLAGGAEAARARSGGARRSSDPSAAAGGGDAHGRSGPAQGRGRPVAPPARFDLAAHRRGSGRGGASRPRGARARRPLRAARRRRGDRGRRAVPRHRQARTARRRARDRRPAGLGRAARGAAGLAGARPGAGRHDRASSL